MNNSQKRTLILASLINNIIYQHIKGKECNRDCQKIKRKMARGMRESSRKFKDYVTVVSIDADKIWKKATLHFKTKKINIELSSIILELLAKDEKALATKYGLNLKLMEKWATPSKNENALEYENNSRYVADFIDKSICDMYQLEVKKRFKLFGDKNEI